MRRLRASWGRLGDRVEPRGDDLAGDEQGTLRALERLEARLISEGRWTAGPATLFGALRLTNNEVLNCRVLAWLLDPMAPHGLGATVLSSLLDYLSPRTDEVLPTTPGGVERAVIDTEVLRDNSRADLVIVGSGWTIIVEAKLGAFEQPAQGQRLAADWPDAVYVFLTRAGAPMRTTGQSEWAPMRWTDMRGLVRAALAAASDPRTAAMATARAAVRDYLIATGTMEHDGL